MTPIRGRKPWGPKRLPETKRRFGSAVMPCLPQIKMDGRRTVVRNSKDELKTGTLHAMLKQLGLTKHSI